MGLFFSLNNQKCELQNETWQQLSSACVVTCSLLLLTIPQLSLAPYAFGIWICMGTSSQLLLFHSDLCFQIPSRKQWVQLISSANMKSWATKGTILKNWIENQAAFKSISAYKQLLVPFFFGIFLFLKSLCHCCKLLFSILENSYNIAGRKPFLGGSKYY